MRLLVINSIRAFGGGEGWVLTTSRGLAARGHAVWVACQPDSALRAVLGAPATGRRGDGALSETGRRGDGATGRKSRTRLLAPSPRLPISPSPTRTGIPVVCPVPMGNDISPLAFCRLAGLCRRLRPDVVLVCNERAARLGAPAARAAGVASVVMRSGLEGSFGNKAWNRWLARHCISHFVVNARALRAELLSYGWVRPERATVIYNGIDLGAAAARRSRQAVRGSLSVGEQTPLVLCAARLARDKGQDDLIRAVPALLPGYPDLVCLLAGEGTRRAELEALVESTGLRAHVRFLGFRDDVPDLLTAADVVAIASHREGLPNVALEALAAGRPLVATAVSGTPEAVIDGRTGLLVPPGRPDLLATAIAGLLSDPGAARLMGERGRDWVGQAFSAAVALDRWEEFLESVASSS